MEERSRCGWPDRGSSQQHHICPPWPCTHRYYPRPSLKGICCSIGNSNKRRFTIDITSHVGGDHEKSITSDLCNDRPPATGEIKEVTVSMGRAHPGRPSVKRSAVAHSLGKETAPAQKRSKSAATVHVPSEQAVYDVQHDDTAHPASPMRPRCSDDPVPRKDGVNTTSNSLASQLPQNGPNDPVQWDQEPDWLAAYDPTQHFPTQMNPTQPCCFEAILSAKTSNPPPPDKSRQSIASVWPQSQMEQSQPHALSLRVSGHSSGASAGEALPKERTKPR